jgi:Integrase core domain
MPGTATTVGSAAANLDGEIAYSLREAQVVIESWRRHYNAVRPHASLGYRAPAPEVFVPARAPAGTTTDAAPTFNPNHPVGAGQHISHAHHLKSATDRRPRMASRP